MAERKHKSSYTAKLPKRKTKPEDANPIEAALTAWFETLPEQLVRSLELDLERLLLSGPKRWVVYPPMVLLPSGSFGDVFLPLSLEKGEKDALWKEILTRIGKREGKGSLTHLAINSGIPHNKSENLGENILRTPSGLVMLYGDFGPALSPDQVPNESDFEEAFWVSTKQNGITQVWAPRYTMFSRGNVKEKARLLDFHASRSPFESRQMGRDELEKRLALDLYAGIGYLRRVLGWELNSWSVEGLRRGAVANGWSVRVVRDNESWEVSGEKIVVFLEDNQRAIQRSKSLDRVRLGRVSHVNGGLLPTSEASWETSLELLEANGWLHLHENVGVNDVDQRKVEIESMFRHWLEGKRDERRVNIEHVEFVKTFAPGVWHCVFDVYIKTS
jgi:tRNA wybutosine-synthesizing protein 2